MPTTTKPALVNGKPNAALNAYRRKWWNAKDPKTNKPRRELSPNFDAFEFNCHDGSVVPTRAREALVRLCVHQLEPMRKKFGACTVLSGYRHRPYNISIGGALHSQHIYEETPDSVAADTRYARGSSKEWSAYARSLRKGGVGEYIRSNFTHLDNGPVRTWKGN